MKIDFSSNEVEKMVENYISTNLGSIAPHKFNVKVSALSYGGNLTVELVERVKDPQENQ